MNIKDKIMFFAKVYMSVIKVSITVIFTCIKSKSNNKVVVSRLPEMSPAAIARCAENSCSLLLRFITKPSCVQAL